MPRSKSNVKQQPELLDKLLHATPSLVFRGLVGVVLGYAFVSRAFDTGSYWQYGGALVFTILGIRLLKRSFTNNHAKVKTSKTR
ncbi:hypothetical protein KDA00_03065 [Candidatus Saccharibacteria bacterium]|nr:hypothetical protein [Candidatus Saccharibacteria bacterium]